MTYVDPDKGASFYATVSRASSEGPWSGVEDLFPPGKAQLPRSVSGLLKAAQEHGWGFGPISLVMRLNREDAQPMYVTWLYGIPSGSWTFAGAGLRNGHSIKKAAEVTALVKTEPWKPDYGRYQPQGGPDGEVYLWCHSCEAFALGPGLDASLPEFPDLLNAIENHEKEHHAATD